MEHNEQTTAKMIWDHYQNDISAFIGGFSLTTCFAAGTTMVGSVITAMAVGFFGGIVGVIGKEVGALIVRTVKSYFR